jgi:Spy/CpxP family protein refolding chaperone
MKKIFCSVALICLLAPGATGVTFAQDNSVPTAQKQGDGPSRHLDPDKLLRKMTRELDLTSDQQSQIKPILIDQNQKAKAVFQDQSLSDKNRRSRMKSIRADNKVKIEALLTPVQKQKYEAMKMNTRHGGGEHSQS